MLRTIRLEIEKRLRNRGIVSPDMRRVLSGQLLFTVAALVAGCLLLSVSVWPLAFGLGTLIAAVNLWCLARFVVRSVGRPYSPALGFVSFCTFLARFALTGIVLYLLLVRLHIPVVPLLAGLSTVVVGLAFRGAARLTGSTFKEA